ncbi:MAG: archaemetzincin [Vicinamibacteria bacterium]|jgi:archaemetzincin|nr:archaemetzincin [Vicinamibacteria bacterium]
MTWLALAPLGAPPEIVMERVIAALVDAFALTVRSVASIMEPAEAYDERREQWAATEFLKVLLAGAPRDASWLLGVTERDLFVPVLSFVYGQAQLRGRAAVISLARLRPEYYDLPADPALLGARAEKEAVHEVGHLFGLVHCVDRRCPMSLSIGLQDLDFKSAEPCASCAALLTGLRAGTRPRVTGVDTEGGRR